MPTEGHLKREGTLMPRELTRQSVRQEARGSRLDIEVNSKDMTVRVALSGILDQQGLERVIHRVARSLLGRGCRVVLDGSSLTYMDYRCTRDLICWNRNLRQYRHQLYFQNWNNYLKAILCMEDWERELPMAFPLPSISCYGAQS
mgnify:CR=1 FL=1